MTNNQNSGTEPSKIPGYVVLVLGIILAGLSLMDIAYNFVIGLYSLKFYSAPMIGIAMALGCFYISYRMLGGKDDK